MRIDMSRLKDIITIAIMLAVPISLVGLWVWMWSWLPDGNSDNEVSADTLRVVVYDTIPYFLPMPVDSSHIGNVTARLPIAKHEDVDASADSVQALSNSSSIGQDSAEVVFPITQKVYEDSTYRAYVSGYRASLDSLLMFPQREVVTITAKPKRWTIGLQMGMAVVYDGQWRVGPGVMIGLSYRF